MSDALLVRMHQDCWTVKGSPVVVVIPIPLSIGFRYELEILPGAPGRMSSVFGSVPYVVGTLECGLGLI